MTKEREALRLALKALEEAHYKDELKQDATKRYQAITAVFAALAQPEQEPLVWKLKDTALSCGLLAHITTTQYNLHISDVQRCYEFITPPAAQPEQEPVAWMNDMGTHIDLNVSSRGTPLYTTPPKRPWVGLTDDDCKSLSAGEKVVAMWAARTLKEKNT